MSDISDDGHLLEESYFTNSINYNNPYNNNYYHQEELQEECKFDYFDDDNYIYNISYLEDEKNYPKSTNDNNSKNFLNNFNIMYEDEKYFNGNSYYNNYYNECDQYNYINSYNSYKYEKKNDYLKKKRLKEFVIYKNKDFYLTSFAIEFKLWLIKEISVEKKKMIFDKNKKVNKEIIKSINNIYSFKNKNKEIEKINLNMDITDINMKKIVKGDMNLEFKIVINEDVDVYFLKKYIEMKIKGEIVSNKTAKFNFQVKQYKFTLNDENNAKNDDSVVFNIDNNKSDKYYDVLELDMKSQDDEDDKDFKENIENDKDNIAEHKRKIKMYLNELIENF